jgi:eukaryotic-like serine/threonine-protein kinase
VDRRGLVLGDTLGNRYLLSALLGTGGMAEVFLAHDRMLGRDLALKVLMEHYAKDERFVWRFRKEAQSAAALNHPNVVQIYDQGRAEDGRYYIAMEHVPGGSLEDLILRRGPLAPAEAARLASQVAEALHAAHGRGIVHRDIKPQNVLIGEADDAKVADFGIALAASRTSTSGTNLLFGTPSYMSPEQAMGERVGPESDLYSLGVVLYEMLTGTVPFAAEGPLATAMKHLTELPLPPRKRNASVPEAMDALVMGLLSKDPEDRYPSAAQLIEDLRRAREGLPLAFAGATAYPETLGEPRSGPPSVLAGSPRSKPRRRRSVGIRLVALATLLSLLGGLGWDLSQAPKGLKTVGAVKSLEGGREGGTLVAPKGFVGAREDGSGKRAGREVPAAPSAPASASPASVSASASVAPEPPAPEPVASGPWASKPQASGPWVEDPSASSPAPDGSSGSGGQEGAGTLNPGADKSAAKEQYQ